MRDSGELSRVGLAAGIAVSLATHAGGGVLLVSAALNEPSPGAIDSEDHPDLLDRPPVRLGLVQSNNVSISWLGFEDPTPHASTQLAEFEQAALVRDAAGSQAPSPGNPVPSESATEQADPGRAAPDPPVAPPVEDPSRQDIRDDSTDPDAVVASEEPTSAASIEVADGQRDDAADESEQSSSEGTPEPDERQAPTGAVAEAARPPSETASQRPGEASDRDSTPTSREITMTLDRLGRPAAGEGVEIKTVLPDERAFKTVRMLAGRLRDPVVVIEFAHDPKGADEAPAVVRAARFDRVETPGQPVVVLSTGNDDIDSILLFNIYRWTATGQAFETLESDEALIIRLTIDLR